MSFIHNFRVGYLDLDGKKFVQRPLERSAIMEALRRFSKVRPTSVVIQSIPNVDGDETLAFIDGDPIDFDKKGYLVCPYIGRCGFNMICLVFIRYLCDSLSCKVYSDDEGAFVEPKDFLVSDSLLHEIIKEVLAVPALEGNGETHVK